MATLVHHLLVPALLAAAAWLLTQPASTRRLRRARAGPNSRGRRLSRSGTRSVEGRGAGAPLGSLLVEVAARMRTGAAARSAWRDTLAEEPGAPASLEDLAATAKTTARKDAVAGARAAVQVADRLGAPVADVLHSCAQGLSEAEEAASQRRTALAAPRATARLLTWMPVAGLGLGALLGVRPLAVFTDGGAGTACFLLGMVLTVAGRRWSGALVRQAERAGR